jgi:hypothetical protein
VFGVCSYLEPLWFPCSQVSCTHHIGDTVQANTPTSCLPNLLMSLSVGDTFLCPAFFSFQIYKQNIHNDTMGGNTQGVYE